MRERVALFWWISIKSRAGEEQRSSKIGVGWGLDVGEQFLSFGEHS